MNLEINSNDIVGSFDRMASELMNEYVLKVGNAKYRITEIEFYYNSEEHKDTYSHQNELQKTTGKWYFHGSGIDLTFGSGDRFGGILLRAIYNLDNAKYVYGPLKIITEIFSNVDNVFETNLSFGLIPASNKLFEAEVPIKAQRVGLNKVKDPDKYDQLYRYLVMPKMKHADKMKIAESMRKQKKSEDEIAKIWG